MAYGENISVRASSAATASGQSAAVRCANVEQVSLLVDVTAVTGTSPSMTLSVEWSDDGTTWFAPDVADAFTAITTAVKRAREFDVKAPFMRVVWTITGTTPSFTFAVDAYLN